MFHYQREKRDAKSNFPIINKKLKEKTKKKKEKDTLLKKYDQWTLFLEEGNYSSIILDTKEERDIFVEVLNNLFNFKSINYLRQYKLCRL